MSRPQWKAPAWLIFADMVGVLALFLGLSMQYAPDGPIASALPPDLKLPLLIGGGLLVVFCGLTLFRMIRAQRRG